MTEVEWSMLYEEARRSHRNRHDQLKMKVHDVTSVPVIVQPAQQPTSHETPRTINEVLGFRAVDKPCGPGRPSAGALVHNKTYPLDEPERLKKWKTILPWVFHKGDCMFCSLCLSRKSTNNFASGTRNFQTSSLYQHAGQWHAQDMQVLDRPLVAAFRKAQELQKTLILCILEVVYLIGKKKLGSVTS